MCPYISLISWSSPGSATASGSIMSTENEDVLDTYFTFVAQADGKFAESLKKAKRTLRDVEGMSHDVSYFT